MSNILKKLDLIKNISATVCVLLVLLVSGTAEYHVDSGNVWPLIIETAGLLVCAFLTNYFDILADEMKSKKHTAAYHDNMTHNEKTAA